MNVSNFSFEFFQCIKVHNKMNMMTEIIFILTDSDNSTFLDNGFGTLT